ncbi:MAG: right-handed parallel beta-helix repeat-containing protein [Tunicatimonas sp.]
MNHRLLCILMFASTLVAQGQSEDPLGEVVITSKPGETQVRVDEEGRLLVNVSPQNARTLQANGRVRYHDFGARGDGQTDDTDAIAAAHAFANRHGLPVRTDDSATYYLSGKKRTAVIQTDTDFGTAAFIIDDTDVQDRNAPIFLVTSSQQPFALEGVSSLARNQQKLNVSVPTASLVTVTNSDVKHYIRFGLNQDNGSEQTDIFIIDKDGNVAPYAPIVWDFDQITEATALPLDKDTLTITGGRFTTIANQAESKYTYYSRNIIIRRSRVVVDGLEHIITGEGDQGAPYGGFITIRDCAYVTVKNTRLTGHKTYRTIGRAGKPVSMGSYDLSVGRALNVSFINCTQSNDIDDRTYWGILGSNYSKNLLYDYCTLSRFDAHKGVANATIRNSTLGHMGINAIGSGTLTVENTTVRGRSLVNLRSDYGSTWQGEFIIRNCTFVPNGGRPTTPVLISGSYSGQHDFGYVCYMPERIVIENLRIDDRHHPPDYPGPAIFADFNPRMTDASYREKFPYVKTEEVVLENVTTASGHALRLSDNPYMFREVEVKRE